MILNQLFCPSCNIQLNDKLFFKQNKGSIQLDKIYYYNYLQLFCNNCKEQICVFHYDKPILWKKRDEYSYVDFLVKKKNTKLLNKKFLYLYYPCKQNFIIEGLCNNISFEQFDAVVTTQNFYEKIKDIDKQICVIPNYLFEHLNNSLLPNYFVQKIIIRQSQKFDRPMLYSSYYTFFNCFQLIYKSKNWNLINKYLKNK